MPRFSIGIGVALRWPWRIGWDPFYAPEPGTPATYGRTVSWSLDVGLVTLTAHFIANPKEWFR